MTPSIRLAVFTTAVGASLLGSWLASSTSARADSKRSTPDKQAQPAPVPTTPTPAPLPDKPKPLWGEGDCFGSMVFLDNKSWRECCLLCAVGDDNPSSVEKLAAERDHEKIVVTNYFSLASSGRANRGGGGDRGGGDRDRDRDDGDSNRSEARGGNEMGRSRGEKREESLHRRYRNGIPALKSLSPSMGGDGR